MPVRDVEKGLCVGEQLLPSTCRLAPTGNIIWRNQSNFNFQCAALKKEPWAWFHRGRGSGCCWWTSKWHYNALGNGKGEPKGRGLRGNWLLKHIVNRLHNELRLLFETGRWKLRRKCNRRDVDGEGGAKGKPSEEWRRKEGGEQQQWELWIKVAESNELKLKESRRKETTAHWTSSQLGGGWYDFAIN